MRYVALLLPLLLTSCSPETDPHKPATTDLDALDSDLTAPSEPDTDPGDSDPVDTDTTSAADTDPPDDADVPPSDTAAVPLSQGGPIPPGGGIEVRSDCTLAERFFPADGPVVRVIGIYGPVTAQGGIGQQNPGLVEVNVNQPTVLVLLSSESSSWTVREQFPGTVRDIYVSSHAHPTVQAPRGVPVHQIPIMYAEHWDSREAREVERELAILGFTADSFHGCHRGEHWQIFPSPIPNVIEQPPRCPAIAPSIGAPDLAALLPGCPQIAGDPEICLTRYPEPTLVGLASGATCGLLAPPTSGYDFDSLGWGDRYMYSCNEWGKLTRTDLVSGVADEAYTYCDDVTVYDGGLVLNDREGGPGSLDWYPSFEAAQCGSRGWGGVNMWNSRLGAEGDILYSAWHSTDHIERMNLRTGASLPDLPMQGYSGWVNGVDALGQDKVLVLTDSAAGWEISQFDGNTGDLLLPPIPVSNRAGGLSCVRR
jgi:hypothetical protein